MDFPSSRYVSAMAGVSVYKSGALTRTQASIEYIQHTYKWPNEWTNIENIQMLAVSRLPAKLRGYDSVGCGFSNQLVFVTHRCVNAGTQPVNIVFSRVYDFVWACLVILLASRNEDNRIVGSRDQMVVVPFVFRLISSTWSTVESERLRGTISFHLSFRTVSADFPLSAARSWCA